MEQAFTSQSAAESELARCSEALVQAGRLEPTSLWTSFPTKAQWTKAHADELRVAGNESYKIGALHDAIRFYENAINVATAIQEDSLLPTYLSNLSAAYYESGEYEKSLDVIDRTFECLQLQSDAGRAEVPTPLDVKLRIRECRCLLHISEFDQLLDAVQEVGQSVYDEHMEFGVIEDAALHSLDQLASWDAERARKLVPRLPRYRPSMRKHTKRSRRSMVGRGSALIAIADASKDREAPRRGSRIMIGRSPPQQSHLSFFYGGCGDPRHALATIIDVLQQKPDPEFNFELKMALVDENPAVIARNVLIFFILDDLSSKNLAHQPSQEVTEILTVLHYAYLGAIMPNWVFEKLLGYIRVVSTKLCSGLGVPSWLTISLASIDRIIPVFKFWVRGAADTISIQDWMDMQQPLDKSNDINATTNVPPELKQRLKDSRESARADIKDAIFNFSDAQLNTILRNKCANAKKMTSEAKKDLAFQLFATDEALDTLNRKRYVPDSLLMEYSTFYQGSLKILYGPDELIHKEPKLAENLRDLWAAWGAAQNIDTNSTATDNKHRTLPLLTVREYVKTHWKINVTLLEESCATDPFNTLSDDVSFDPFTASQQLARCIESDVTTKPRRTYDFTSTFFLHAARSLKIYGSSYSLEWMVDESHHVLENITKSPEETNFDFFDQIYFLTPPDTTGGLLSQAVDSMAILKPTNQAFLASKIVNRNTHFNSLEALFLDHFSLPSTLDAQRYLGLGLYGSFTGDFFLANFIRLRPVDPANITTITLAGKNWKAGPAVHRNQLIDWLFQIFLRIAVPLRNTTSDCLRQQPVNLHSFFRLLLYLQSIDFPSHWLSSVVDDIIQNRVFTRSRPYNVGLPQANSNTEKQPLKAICMTPFSLEMEVALTIWFPLLTFGITAVEFPDAANVRTYTIKLNPVTSSLTPEEESRPLLALWFSTNSAKKINLDLARDIVGNHNAVQSARILSSFEWNEQNKMAKFMCNISSMELLQIQNFTVRLIRVDTYETVSVVAPVKHCVGYSTLSAWQEPV